MDGRGKLVAERAQPVFADVLKRFAEHLLWLKAAILIALQELATKESPSRMREGDSVVTSPALEVPSVYI